jgi:ABC-type Fe3+/spermidine/putrescine transport system ATPase subunit
LGDLNITTLYVTHNQEEALVMADRIAVMNEGRIEQIATPTDIYQDPETEFVARFIGDTNTVPSTLDLAASEDRSRAGADDAGRNTPSRFVRPEDVGMVSDRRNSEFDVNLSGRIDQMHFLGSKVRYQVITESEDFMISLDTESMKRFSEGDEVTIGWNESDVHYTAAGD